MVRFPFCLRQEAGTEPGGQRGLSLGIEKTRGGEDPLALGNFNQHLIAGAH
jgi:hypothetical protein